MLADGTLDFCRLWLFITALLSVTRGMWWEAALGTQSSPSLFLHAGPALLPSLCAWLMQAPSALPCVWVRHWRPWCWQCPQVGWEGWPVPAPVISGWCSWLPWNAHSQVAHTPSRGTALDCVQGGLHRKAVLAVSHPCLALGCWGSSSAGTICSREP